MYRTQEEDFADTGYQVTPSDTGSAPPAFPSGMQQLGALTAEDFNRKLGTANEEGRWVNHLSSLSVDTFKICPKPTVATLDRNLACLACMFV